MPPRNKQLNTLWLLALPVLLGSYYWLNNPFAETISSRIISVSELSAAQKSNIKRAAQTLNGLVIKPQDTFSFNTTVGPRTSNRGYLPAPSYLETGSPQTPGGGICLLSSAIYQSALQTGLIIKERQAHLRTIKTVKPGLDATVWYGQTDLSFSNPHPYPLQLLCHEDNQQLQVEFKARRGAAKDNPISLRRLVDYPSPNQVQVRVLRQNDRTCTLISRDTYRLSGFQLHSSDNHGQANQHGHNR